MAEPEQGPAKRAKPASWSPEEKLKLLREHIQSLPWPAWPLGTVPSDTELENLINHFIEASGENPRPRAGIIRQLRTILAAGADEPVLTAATRLQELTTEVCAGLGPWREPTAEWSALQDRTLLAAHIAELPASWEGAGLADTRIEAVVARFNSVDRTHSADSVVRRLCALLTFSGVRPTSGSAMHCSPRRVRRLPGPPRLPVLPPRPRPAMSRTSLWPRPALPLPPLLWSSVQGWKKAGPCQLSRGTRGAIGLVVFSIQRAAWWPEHRQAGTEVSTRSCL